jgi:hypothetical protein
MAARCWFCRKRRIFGFGPTIYRRALWGKGQMRDACGQCRRAVGRKQWRRTHA